MREHIAADEPFEREDVNADAALDRFRAEGQDYKVELIEDLVARPVASTPSASTPTARSPTSAAARTRRRPSASAPSSCSRSPAPTGAATPTARCSRASTAPRSSSRRTSTSTSSASSRPRPATTASSAASSGCSRSRRSRRASPSGCRSGTTLFNQLVALNRAMQAERGYEEVKTPLIYESSLWETSGHWGKYKENIFVSEYEDREFGFKPMNCPGHAHLFGLQRWSYRDLPFRCAEPGLLHRREPSGTLHGLLRVRHFIQDDAHIFCTEDQIQDEVARLPGLRLRGLRAVRLPGACRALDAARQPPRQRRVLGPGRGRARRGPGRAAASSTRSPRAKARSTRRRSTCT